MTMALVDLAKHVEAILEGSIARQQIAFAGDVRHGCILRCFEERAEERQ